MIDSQSAAIRKAMMLDAEWQHADAKFFAACEVPDTGPSQSRRQWQRAAYSKKYDANPEQRKRRNAQRRAQRVAARLTAQSKQDSLFSH
jgi:hypothetical protein